MFIRSVSREQDQADHLTLTESLARIEAALAAAHERLERIERSAHDPNRDPNRVHADE
jgi:hypothetical protein